MITVYPAPGRGAWRRLGGLLPDPPKSAGSVGYYRLNVGSEIPVGSAWLRRTDVTHHAEAVHLGVRAIQRLVGATQDGWFGMETAGKVVAQQKKLGLGRDGIVGPTTMRALLLPVIMQIAAITGVPVPILGGLLVHESALDPAAVGVNGEDHGLAQINLAAHRDTVTLWDAMDPEYAIHWTAEDLAQEHDTWENRTTADPWKIAIAHHNSPLLARRWAKTGVPPVVTGRVFQIEEYVNNVLAAW